LGGFRRVTHIKDIGDVNLCSKSQRLKIEGDSETRGGYTGETSGKVELIRN